MAGARDIQAGKASVLLTLKNQLARGLKVAQDQLNTFARNAKKISRGLGLIGATLLAPFAAAFHQSEKVREKMDEIAKVIGDALAPAIMPVLDAMLDIAKRVGAWAKANPDIVRNVLKIGVGLLIAAGVLKLMAVSASLLAVSLGVAGAIISSPILTVITAMAALTAAWVTFTQRGRESARAIGSSLREALKPLMDIAGTAFGAALAGQFRAAGEVLGAAMELGMLGAIKSTLDKSVIPILSMIPGMGGMLGGVVSGAASKTLTDRIGDVAGELTRAMAVANAARGGAAGLDESSKMGPLSAGTAGGAYALTFGQSQNLPAKSYAKLQEIKRGIYELVKKAQREQFRRDRPGLFGK